MWALKVAMRTVCAGGGRDLSRTGRLGAIGSRRVDSAATSTTLPTGVALEVRAAATGARGSMGRSYRLSAAGVATPGRTGQTTLPKGRRGRPRERNDLPLRGSDALSC